MTAEIFQPFRQTRGMRLADIYYQDRVPASGECGVSVYVAGSGAGNVVSNCGLLQNRSSMDERSKYDAFRPVVDHKVLIDYPTRLLQRGAFVKVPLIIGSVLNRLGNIDFPPLTSSQVTTRMKHWQRKTTTLPLP